MSAMLSRAAGGGPCAAGNRQKLKPLSSGVGILAAAFVAQHSAQDATARILVSTLAASAPAVPAAAASPTPTHLGHQAQLVALLPREGVRGEHLALTQGPQPLLCCVVYEVR